MEGIYLSSASYLLLVGLAVLLALLAVRRRSPKGRNYAPGPKPWPIIGSLHLMGGYDLPYKAFDALSKVYGPVVSLRLGQVDCLVVSSLDTIKEILFIKGDHFDGRPNFSRYNDIFGGNRDNSLAFCDRSPLQKSRREILQNFTFPKAFSHNFHQLESLVNKEIGEIMTQFDKGETNVKLLFLHACGNIFFSYFAAVRFELEDVDFTEMLKNFDLVFYEVNQGYAADFMPWLSPLLMRQMARTRQWGAQVRKFMLERVVKKGGAEGDLLHTLLAQVKAGKMEMETAMFTFEDLVGGHTAVANLLVKMLGFISQYPETQKKMQEEVDAVTCGKTVNLGDRCMMTYTQAVILECIRCVCSPIIPHVASQDTTVNGYDVDKGTLIFLNNYTLHMSPELWTEPEKFSPERFLNEDGSLIKPEHFLPFGGGKRSCMGYKMTQFISFATIATIMQRFTVTPVSKDTKIPLGDLALPYETLNFNLLPR